MQIPVKDLDEPVAAEFCRYDSKTQRLWLFDPRPAVMYRTVGRYCPHKNLGRDECQDCSLVLEGDDDE